MRCRRPKQVEVGGQKIGIRDVNIPVPVSVPDEMLVYRTFNRQLVSGVHHLLRHGSRDLTFSRLYPIIRW